MVKAFIRTLGQGYRFSPFTVRHQQPQCNSFKSQQEVAIRCKCCGYGLRLLKLSVGRPGYLDNVLGWYSQRSRPATLFVLNAPLSGWFDVIGARWPGTGAVGDWPGICGGVAKAFGEFFFKTFLRAFFFAEIRPLARTTPGGLGLVPVDESCIAMLATSAWFNPSTSLVFPINKWKSSILSWWLHSSNSRILIPLSTI